MRAADDDARQPWVWSPGKVGTEGIKRQALLLRTAMPDLRVVLNDQVAEGSSWAMPAPPSR